MNTQQSFPQYIEQGQTPFFRLPTSVPEGTSVRPDCVLLGVTYDGGTTYMPGARLAPYHVRRVSALVQSYHPGHGVDVFSELNAIDGGNIMVPPFNAGAMREMVQQRVAAVVESGAAPVLIGGDHSITLL